MKKVSLLLLLLFIIGLSACSNPIDGFLHKDDRMIANDRFEEIMAALKANDKTALEALFSDAVKKDEDVLEIGVEYALETFKGDVLSIEQAIKTSSSTKGGQRIKEIKCKSIVKTDVDTFLVFFVEVEINDYNSDEIGLYMLQIIPYNDKDGNFDWGTEIRCPGVYIP